MNLGLTDACLPPLFPLPIVFLPNYNLRGALTGQSFRPRTSLDASVTVHAQDKGTAYV